MKSVYDIEMETAALMVINELTTVNMIWGPVDVHSSTKPEGWETAERAGAVSVRKMMERIIEGIMQHAARDLWEEVKARHAKERGHHEILKEVYIIVKSQQELWELRSFMLWGGKDERIEETLLTVTDTEASGEEQSQRQDTTDVQDA
eukprot:3937208-Rhodomonas_salina.13